MRLARQKLDVDADKLILYDGLLFTLTALLKSRFTYLNVR